MSWLWCLGPPGYQNEDDCQHSNGVIKFDNQYGVNSAGSFKYIVSKMKNGRRRSNGRDLLCMLGCELKIHLPNQKVTKVVGLTSKLFSKRMFWILILRMQMMRSRRSIMECHDQVTTGRISRLLSSLKIGAPQKISIFNKLLFLSSTGSRRGNKEQSLWIGWTVVTSRI